jgi:STE24 endopeptidase
MSTPSIHPLLDEEKQRQARQYEKEKRLLGLAGSLLSLVFLLAFYLSGFSAYLAQLRFGSTMIWTVTLYLFILVTLATLVIFPLNYYSGYLHEHKWHFSNHTVVSWLWEQLKGYLVGLVLTLLLVGLLFWVMAAYPAHWWWIASLASIAVGVLLTTLAPVVIFPIFNKYDPIEDQELTRRLEKLLAKVGLRSSGFFKEDMSYQTKKENAFLAGLGKTRRVVLADNLLEHMSIPEIESVIAHEVGHYKHRHLAKQILIGSLQQLVVFFVLDRVINWGWPHFLESTRWNLTLFPIFIFLYSFLSGLVLGPLSHAIARYWERQADRSALRLIPQKEAFQTALAGLANRNLSNAYPAWWVKLLYYSHPPIGERLALAEASEET